eukprot:364808-Chlamydomonas_euryale.AAC.5
MPCHAMPCHAMPCHAMPCHNRKHHAIKCHVMPCHATQTCGGLSFEASHHVQAPRRITVQTTAHLNLPMQLDVLMHVLAPNIHMSMQADVLMHVLAATYTCTCKLMCRRMCSPQHPQTHVCSALCAPNISMRRVLCLHSRHGCGAMSAIVVPARRRPGRRRGSASRVMRGRTGRSRPSAGRRHRQLQQLPRQLEYGPSHRHGRGRAVVTAHCNLAPSCALRAGTGCGWRLRGWGGGRRAANVLLSFGGRVWRRRA